MLNQVIREETESLKQSTPGASECHRSCQNQTRKMRLVLGKGECMP